MANRNRLYSVVIRNYLDTEDRCIFLYQLKNKAILYSAFINCKLQIIFLIAADKTVIDRGST